MATKKKQKEAKTARAKKLATVDRKKKIAAAVDKFQKASGATGAMVIEVAGKLQKAAGVIKAPAPAPVSGANTKRAVSSLLVEWPEAEIGPGFRRVVQDGVSPADTALRLQCRRCGGVEEILAKDALAISADNPPVGFPLEACRDWARRAKKKHRRCGGASTKGVQQGLGLFERIR